MKKYTVICLVLSCFFILSTAVFSVSSASIKKSYIRGDTNRDNQVTIGDVTLIQQVVAGIKQDRAGSVLKRGDVDNNGLDISDAYAIQKYLAAYDDPYKIGETVREDPELPTDEYELPIYK